MVLNVSRCLIDIECRFEGEKLISLYSNGLCVWSWGSLHSSFSCRSTLHLHSFDGKLLPYCAQLVSTEETGNTWVRFELLRVISLFRRHFPSIISVLGHVLGTACGDVTQGDVSHCPRGANGLVGGTTPYMEKSPNLALHKDKKSHWVWPSGKQKQTMAGDTSHHCFLQQLDVGEVLESQNWAYKTRELVKSLRAVTSMTFTLFKGFGVRHHGLESQFCC